MASVEFVATILSTYYNDILEMDKQINLWFLPGLGLYKVFYENLFLAQFKINKFNLLKCAIKRQN